MPAINYKKILSVTLKATVSAGFVLWLVYKVQWMMVWHKVQSADIRLIALYVVFLLLGMWISAYKWRLITQFKEFSCTTGQAFRAYLTGTFINNFLPSFIGGDAYRAYWLTRQDARYGAAVSTLVMDRFTGLWGAMVLALCFSWIHWTTVREHPLWVAIDIIFALSLAADVVLPFLRQIRWFQKLVTLLPRQFGRLVEELAAYSDLSFLARILGWGLAFNLVGIALANFVLFESLGNAMSFTQFAAAIFLVNVVASIPVSINNIGIKEWAYYTFFGFLGASPEAAITVALMSRFIQMLISFFALSTYLRVMKDFSLANFGKTQE